MDIPTPSVGSPAFYALFAFIVTVLIAIDMCTLKHQGNRPPSIRTALVWSGVWLTIALAFGAGLWLWLAHNPAFGPEFAHQKALEFFTGYVIEKALAIDNIFVFLLIFSFFRIHPSQQRRVLTYGVLGAIVSRALMVGIGSVLVREFAWILYLFGAFLLYTGIHMLFGSEAAPALENSRLLP